MNSNTAGLKAIVTGGASGIGAAIVQHLIQLGATVSVLDIDPSSVPTGVLGYVCNISDDAQVRTAVESAAKDMQGVDIVVNNAGVGAQGTIESNDDAEWHMVWDINILGMVRVTRAALPHLRNSGNASIVNVSSIASTAGLPERALYSATKGAISSLTRAMAADHLYEGIRVNAVNPGTADTPWVKRLLSSTPDPEAELRALNARQPHGRLVSPDEVAAAVCYLVGPHSGSTTGSSIAVDGGMQELRLRPRS